MTFVPGQTPSFENTGATPPLPLANMNNGRDSGEFDFLGGTSSVGAVGVTATAPMVVCGDDALAYRLTSELTRLYDQPVTAVVTSARSATGLRLQRLARADGLPITIIEAASPSEDVLLRAGVATAEALTLAYTDDQQNIHAALRARRLNPRIRLVLRLFNRKLGGYLEDLLTRATPSTDPAAPETTTTVLSDADTAAPALVAAALAGERSRIVEAGGLLLRAADRMAGEPVGAAGAVASGELCTLAVLSEPAEPRRTDGDADPVPLLLPDEARVETAAATRDRVVLEAITRQSAHLEHPSPAMRLRRRLPRVPLRELFPPRLVGAVAGLVGLEMVFAVLTWRVTSEPPLQAGYLSILDLFGMGDPAIGERKGRQILQLLSGLTGLALLPVLFALVLQAFGSFRTATSLRQPPRGLSGHFVLMGLGKVGSRVLDRLHAFGIDVVCVEQDPQARGVALARSLHVPVVIGDATQAGVLESALIESAEAVLALTSSDSNNLETALYARECKPDIRVVMRLFDDEFAAVVNQAMRASHPQATTRSRSVSTLAAPSFAAAMMGRQILGALPVERSVLVFVALEVGNRPEFEGRTVEEAFRPGAWRVLALDLAAPDERRPDLAATAVVGDGARRPTELAWGLHQGYVLGAHDRVVLATTRRGLAELLQPRAAPRPQSPTDAP